MGKHKKEVDLGKSGNVILRLSDDAKHLQIELDCGKEGLNKTAVNGLIDALEKIREKMER
jgi:hypothetical protein